MRNSLILGVFAGGLLVGGLVWSAFGPRPAVAQDMPFSSWTLRAVAAGALTYAWRMNNETGEVSACVMILGTAAGTGRVLCFPQAAR